MPGDAWVKEDLYTAGRLKEYKIQCRFQLTTNVNSFIHDLLKLERCAVTICVLWVIADHESSLSLM